MTRALPVVTLARLRSALRVSWRPDTAYLGVAEEGNPALGQCYPTAWVLQRFFPNLEIARGQVDTGSSIEAHFWNVDPLQPSAARVDLSWEQFPPGARISSFEVLSPDRPADTPATVGRCERLLERVLEALSRSEG